MLFLWRLIWLILCVPGDCKVEEVFVFPRGKRNKNPLPAPYLPNTITTMRWCQFASSASSQFLFSGAIVEVTCATGLTSEYGQRKLCTEKLGKEICSLTLKYSYPKFKAHWSLSFYKKFHVLLQSIFVPGLL